MAQKNSAEATMEPASSIAGAPHIGAISKCGATRGTITGAMIENTTRPISF